MNLVNNIAELTPINAGEAIFLPLFDPKLHDMTQWEFHCDDATSAEWVQTGDCCMAKATARRFRLRWSGEVPLTDKTAIRLFTSFMEEGQLSGWATVDGRKMILFEKISGGIVPIEPTSMPLGEGLLSGLDLELEFPAVTTFSWNVYWIGVVDLDQDERLRAPLNYPSQWKGFLDFGAHTTLRNPWIATSQELLEWKKILQKEPYSTLRRRLEEEARGWENYRPERDLREFLPVEEHLYRYARVRDRNRPLWDHPMTVLALAGFLCDRPEWSRLAARFLLAMAWTPNWFEGPQACFPGSDWHHVCFVESHNLLAAAFALQFVGDVLTEEGRQLVWRRVEDAWTLVDAKCREPGYRWHMNQGVVFNSIRLAGAAALWREKKESHYRHQVEIAFRDHSHVLDNYLAADGHCCEGPHYYAYSMYAAMSAWIAYATFQQKPLEDVLPQKFIRSNAYLEIMSSVLHPAGFHLPVCASECEAWPLSVLSALRGDAVETFLKHRWTTQFQKQKLTVWDVCSLLSMRHRAKATAEPAAPSNMQYMASGLGSVRWSTPTPGQLLLTAERPSTGHHHFDRGGLLLEARGRLLLVDPGMTNYSFPRCASMREPDWHNTAHPVGLRMKCHNRPEEFDVAYPRAGLLLRQESELLYRFRIELANIYDVPVKKATRMGTLLLDSARAIGTLSVFDEWEFMEPTVLETTWQSLEPWNLQGLSASSSTLQLDCQSMNSADLTLETISDRVNWDFSPLYTLRVRTANGVMGGIKTTISFPL